MKLYLLFSLFLCFSLWMTVCQGSRGPHAWFGSLICKLAFMAHFSQMQSSGAPTYKSRNGDATPSVRKRKVDKASLLGPHCSLCRISGTALDLQRRQSGRPLTRSSKMLWVMCPSHSILLHWVNARGRWVVRYSFIENREGMRVRKWGEYQVGDLRQKRAWSTYKDRKKIPHD